MYIIYENVLTIKKVMLVIFVGSKDCEKIMFCWRLTRF